MNLTIRVRPIRTGDEISVAVEGGFVRRKAPCDGVVVEVPERDVFLPAESLIEALRQLDALPRPTPTVQLPLPAKKPR